MIFSCDAKLLREVLTTVKSATYAKTTLPALLSVQVVAEGNKLTVCGTDLEVYMKLEREVSVIDPGRYNLPLKPMLDMLKGALGTVMVEVEGDAAYIAYKGVTKEVKPADAAEWPPMPEIPATSLTLDCKAAIKKVVGFVSGEETRHVLNGVCLTKRADNSIVAVATDGKMLKVSPVGKKTKKGLEIILPTKACKILATKFPDGDIEVGIVKEKSGEEMRPVRATFSVDGMVLVTRLIEGYYPDFQSVVDGGNADVDLVNISASRLELIDALKEVSSILKPNRGGVKVSTTDDGLCVEAENKEAETKASVHVPATHDNSAVFGLKPGLANTLLNSIEAETITITTGPDGLSPIRFDGDDGDDTIIMPCKIEEVA